MDSIVHDGVFKSEIKLEDGILHRKLTQPSEELILERNKRIRNECIIGDLSFGRQVACIPLNDYEMLCRKYPDLVKGDAKQKAARLHKILSSSEGKKYLVQDKF